ncbi:hypothetical protein ACFQY7_46225 [Actinomadura luteofluorescens]|uniref:hypothetical protein n=1 Tax=Actinomadura luteofluorescens TaxID=46163 RepID=UPI0036351746
MLKAPESSSASGSNVQAAVSSGSWAGSGEATAGVGAEAVAGGSTGSRIGGSAESWIGGCAGGSGGPAAQDGGAVIVRSPIASAPADTPIAVPAGAASATGDASGRAGPTEYTSIGASQCEHLPSVPGVSLPHVGHCIAQTSPFSRLSTLAIQARRPGRAPLPAIISGAPDKSSG